MNPMGSSHEEVVLTADQERVYQDAIRQWRRLNRDYLDWEYKSYSYKERVHQPFPHGKRPERKDFQ